MGPVQHQEPFLSGVTRSKYPGAEKLSVWGTRVQYSCYMIFGLGMPVKLDLDLKSKGDMKSCDSQNLDTSTIFVCFGL